MEKITFLSVFVVLFMLVSIPVYAQSIEQQCLVSGVEITNTISESTTTKMLFRFECAGIEDYKGQVTRMLIKVPYTDVSNLKAEDPYGEMVVLEGPSYISSKTVEDGTQIGVMFRRGLVIGKESSAYSVAIAFDSGSIVKTSESINSIKPGNLADKVKVTIVSTGITEISLPVSKVKYTLKLPPGSSITQTPKECHISEGILSCEELGIEQFKQIEVKWSGASGTGWESKLKNITKNILPKVSNFLKKIVSKAADMLKTAK